MKTDSAFITSVVILSLLTIVAVVFISLYFTKKDSCTPIPTVYYSTEDPNQFIFTDYFGTVYSCTSITWNSAGLQFGTLQTQFTNLSTIGFYNIDMNKTLIGHYSLTSVSIGPISPPLVDIINIYSTAKFVNLSVGGYPAEYNNYSFIYNIPYPNTTTDQLAFCWQY